MSEQRILELVQLLERARDAYYKNNSPIFSDAEYDALEKELRDKVSAQPQFAQIAEPILNRVGNDLTNSDGRVAHARPMLSIENQYTEKDLLDWYTALPAGTAVCLEPKFDGISVSLIYRDGKLVRALTRGTGVAGEDITKQVMAVVSIPKTLSPPPPACEFPRNLEVRGELVMRNSTLERINKEATAVGGKQYTSTRNLTGGTMKLKDVSLIPDREILLQPWDVLGDDAVLPDSGFERLKLIAKAGFIEPICNIAKDGVSVAVALALRLQERETVLKNQMSLETDGVVVKVDSHRIRRQLGISSKYTNYQTCFKPQSASGTTYLREIQWQVGRTGVVSPVSKCEPVVLAGARVTSSSLNNITYIRKLGLKLNAKIEMLRSGDVIPQIVRVLDEGDTEIMPPTECPECQKPLVEKDEGGVGILQQFCTNTLCPGVARETLEFIGSRDVLETDGLGPEMARKLVDTGYARNLGELYQFQNEALVIIRNTGEESFVNLMRKKGFDVTILKMVKSLEKAKTASWERWIKALCIPMIGNTLGKAIAMKLDLQPTGFEFLVPTGLIPFTTQEVEQFGEAKMAAIRDWCTEDNHKLCYTLFQLGVRPTAIEKPKVVAGAPLTGTIFCITGEIDEDRKSLYRKLESLGAIGKSGVSSKVNLLVVLPGAGKSKLTKATELGIKQVGQDWLIQTLAENGLGLEKDFAEAVN
jgi:DNA ligase (NAD+)